MKEEILKKHGELGSFTVRVQHRQNGSWQARITWLEKGQTLHFRSAWELLKLIESAVELGAKDSEREEGPSWADPVGAGPSSWPQPGEERI